jgi:uncharacterized membrane protein YvbJ
MAATRSKDRGREGEGLFACPVCGEEIYEGMLACPECGADDKSGWSSGVYSDPDFETPGEFDYDRFLEDEFGTPRKKSGKETMWAIAAVVLILAFLYWILL